MAWKSYYLGNGSVREVQLDPPPPWRVFPKQPLGLKFKPPKGLAVAVNAALSLRRPLLLTGVAGSGKSSVIESVAEELALGPVLRWNVNSRSVLDDALYSYDVLGRIHEQQLKIAMTGETAARVRAERGEAPAETEEDTEDDIAPFLRLGPLGTALVPSTRPRPLLIDEIDKGDLDLPGDLLNALERGDYEIPELVRYSRPEVDVRMWDSEETYTVVDGKVACTEFPFIVMTSNEERDFPAAFLRRCIRFAMPAASEDDIRAIVYSHLGMAVPDAGPLAKLVKDFAARLEAHQPLAIDQLLNAVFVLSGSDAPDPTQREELTSILLRELTGA